jgi:hypothetical protein
MQMVPKTTAIPLEDTCRWCSNNSSFSNTGFLLL